MAGIRKVTTLAVTGVLALAVTACSGDGGGGDGGGASDGVILGTTDTPSTLDPAGAYDLPSWTIYWNTFQNLLAIAPGESQPSPDAAESCEFTEPTVYTCTLAEGLTFSDGSALTSEDVKFSIDRILTINDPNGPATLFGSVDSIETPDERTVTFHLTTADATFPFVLTTGAAAIVSADTYPADQLLQEQTIVGSGPYQLDSYTDGQQALFTANPEYRGRAERANDSFLIQYYADESALKQEIENGTVDIAFRSLSPTAIEDLRGQSDSGLTVVEGEGTEIRYTVFNVTTPPADNKAVRQAIAQLVDREAIAENVYNGTVDPLYSMIPAGVDGHTEAFQERYGAPDVAKAQAILEEAGVQTPVDLTLWWTPTHYGAATADEYAELERQLDESGLFNVTLESTEWEQYQSAYAEGQYAAFGLGWFPDFPDADNYSDPFLRDGGFYSNNYSNARVNELLTEERTNTDQAVREAALAELQEITAEDVPVLPLWQGKQIAVVRDGISGVADTLDPSFTFRFWMISKS
ncbi:ABC transporter substrate-binding protein [Allostreptomyces psammosilenae]|uniref:Peptide/nickel transport system substrate-binding protein n=1 Tax=Allostreptomyces psammosilenae TaxID=1892865 RepID=A0A852ZNI8_9ACTN|nr:ABC transporter substrate-binding protein [Allostreptomyces psammosilenae]NYI03973.1 peptide/nickel transport system substrate-binding protein [Allostreptomyces psammosilenae]